MIIYYPDKSIFDAKAQVITNTVNCVGVMGKGIAQEFKSRYPEMFEDYKARCSKGEVKAGVPYLWEGAGQQVLNFPTKDHWRGSSRLEWIESGLLWVRQHYLTLGIGTIAFPPLGCGHGGLFWTDVKSLIEKYLGDLDDLLISVYLPRQVKTDGKGSVGGDKQSEIPGLVAASPSGY